MRALSLQPLPLPLPFPNFGRHHTSLVDVIDKHQSLFCVQIESDFLEQPITLERSFFGFVRLLYLDPFEEFQTRFLRRGWNDFFATRTMRTEFLGEEGALSYFGQILDFPDVSIHSSVESLKELAFTYPFPKLTSQRFMNGRTAEFLTTLLSTIDRRPAPQVLASIERGNRLTTQRRQYPMISETPASTDQGGQDEFRYHRPRNIGHHQSQNQYQNSHQHQTLPLAMIPMTRSRRRDQQVLAQTGFGPNNLRGAMTVGTSSASFRGQQFRNMQRRPRQRRPIPEHLLTAGNTANRPYAGIGPPGTLGPRNYTSQNTYAMVLHPPRRNPPRLDSPEDGSMIIVDVERDGQSACVVIDSQNSARRGRRVPSLGRVEEGLGSIMDPDECTICKGSWSWKKRNSAGVPEQIGTPADWRLARLPCRHTYHEECLARWFLISLTNRLCCVV